MDAGFMSSTPKGSSSPSKRDRLREIRHNLYSLIQELGDDPELIDSCRTSKRGVATTDQEVQTEEKRGAAGKKGRKKKKERGGVLRMVAGGVSAGLVFGGIYALVSLLSKPTQARPSS